MEPFDLSSEEQKKSQLGLIELFHCTTLFCVIIGCHSFISQSIAVVLCGAVTVGMVLRLFPCQYAPIGGLMAFGASVTCLPLMLGLGGLSELGGMLLCLGFPSTAYVLGAIYTEFREFSE